MNLHFPQCMLLHRQKTIQIWKIVQKNLNLIETTQHTVFFSISTMRTPVRAKQFFMFKNYAKYPFISFVYISLILKSYFSVLSSAFKTELCDRVQRSAKRTYGNQYGSRSTELFSGPALMTHVWQANQFQTASIYNTAPPLTSLPTALAIQRVTQTLDYRVPQQVNNRPFVVFFFLNQNFTTGSYIRMECKIVPGHKIELFAGEKVKLKNACRPPMRHATGKTNE